MPISSYFLTASHVLLGASCPPFPHSILRLSRLLNVDINVKVARAIARIPSVETIDLSRCEVNDGSMRELSALPRLNKVLLSEDLRGKVKLKGISWVKVEFVRLIPT